jgi:TetR/AcrR family transcriptional regulator, regulator of cefoperazone and chloramphenicol sensitivity
VFVDANGQMGGTKSRLVAAASRLFAESGFHGTTVRDIAARAEANVAAGNYHYGSKKALYLEVLREQFAGIRATLRERGADWSTGELAHLGRPELVRRLRARIKVMLDLLIGPPPGLHGTLLQREMCDPSEALPVIVAEFIAPMHAEMAEIVVRLAPGASRKAVERCVFSIIGQVLFYRFTMPAMLLLQGLKTYPRSYAKELAEHITEFSLGGLAQVSGRASRRRRAR